MLYKQYWEKVYHFCGLYLNNRDVAEDVVQEVFIKVWESREFIREDDNFKGLLFVISRNLIFNQHRKNVNEDFYKMTVLSAMGRRLSRPPPRSSSQGGLSASHWFSYQSSFCVFLRPMLRARTARIPDAPISTSGTYQISRPSSDRIRHNETTPHTKKNTDMIVRNRCMAHIGYGILYLFTSSRCLRLRLWHSLYTIPTPASTNNTATTRSNIQLLFDKAQNILTPSHTSVTIRKITATVKVFLFIGVLLS